MATATETTAALPSIEYKSTPIEDSLIFNRRGSHEQVNFCCQHFDGVNQLHLAVLDSDPDFPEIQQEIELSFQEAKLLRSLLNRSEILAILMSQQQ